MEKLTFAGCCCLSCFAFWLEAGPGFDTGLATLPAFVSTAAEGRPAPAQVSGGMKELRSMNSVTYQT